MNRLSVLHEKNSKLLTEKYRQILTTAKKAFDKVSFFNKVKLSIDFTYKNSFLSLIFSGISLIIVSIWLCSANDIATVAAVIAPYKIDKPSKLLQKIETHPKVLERPSINKLTLRIIRIVFNFFSLYPRYSP